MPPHSRDEFEDAAGFGWTVARPSFDWPTLIADKDARDRPARRHLSRQPRQRRRRRLFDGARRARGPPHASTSASGSRVTAGTILIATGGRPVDARQIPGASSPSPRTRSSTCRHCRSASSSSAAAISPSSSPASSTGSAPRSRCSIAATQILRGFDDDVRGDARPSEMRERGIELALGTDVDRASSKAGRRPRGDARRRPDPLDADLVLCRHRPRAQHRGLGLERPASKLDAQGRDRGRRLFADQRAHDLGRRRRHRPRQPDAGRDPRGPRLRRHRVRRQADARSTTTGPHARCSRQPPIGTVGLTEAEARGGTATVDIYKTRFRPHEGHAVRPRGARR